MNIEQYIESHITHEKKSALLAVDWSSQAEAVEKAFLKLIDVCQSEGYLFIWDNLEDCNGILIQQPNDDPEPFIDFSKIISEVFELSEEQKLEDLEGRIHSEMAELFTNFVADVAIRYISLNLVDVYIHVKYWHDEDVILAYGDKHKPNNLIQEDGGLSLPSTWEDRIERAYSQKNLAQFRDLIVEGSKGNNIIEILGQCDRLVLSLAKKEFETDINGKKLVLEALSIVHKNFYSLFDKQLDQTIANAVIFCINEPTLFDFVEGHLISSKGTKEPRLAFNMAGVSATQNKKDACLKWTKMALELGREVETFLNDSDFKALLEDKEFMDVLNAVGISDKAKNERLYKAADYRKFHEVKYWVEQGADVNYCGGSFRNSVLETAISGFSIGSKDDNCEVVKYLLDAGAECKPDIFESVGVVNVDKGGAEMAQLLMEYGAKPSLKAMNTAVEKRALDVMELFLDKGLDITNISDENENLYRNCRHHETSEVAEYLFLKGAKFDQGEEADRVLDFLGCNPTLLKWALEKGIDVNTHPDGQGNVLAVTVLGDYKECAKILIDAGIDIDHKDDAGRAAVYQAVDRSGYKVLRLLLKSGANPDFQTNGSYETGFTPLHLAAKYGKSQAVKILLQYGARTDIKDEEGKLASEYAEKDSIKKLFQEVSQVLAPN